MEVRTYNIVDEKFIEEWQILWEKSKNASYINGPQWFLSVIESFSFKEHVIVAVYKKHKLVGVAAFMKFRLYGLNVLTIPPGDFVSGTPFLLLEMDSKLLSVLIKEAAKWGPLVLENVPESFVSSLKKCTKRSSFDCLPHALNYFLKVERSSSGEVFVHGRKKLIKEARKIEDEFEITSYNGLDKKALDLAFSIDKKSKKDEYGYSAFSDKRIQTFYSRMAVHFKENLLISILYFRGKPVVYEIGFKVKDVYTGSQVAYDKKYSKYTPGKVSELKVIDMLANMGVYLIDYGSGDSYIKKLICEEYAQLYRVIICSNRLTKMYFRTVFWARNEIFQFLSERKGAYFFYRKLRKII